MKEARHMVKAKANPMGNSKFYYQQYTCEISKDRILFLHLRYFSTTSLFCFFPMFFGVHSASCLVLSALMSRFWHGFWYMEDNRYLYYKWMTDRLTPLCIATGVSLLGSNSSSIIVLSCDFGQSFLLCSIFFTCKMEIIIDLSSQVAYED